MTAHQQKKLDEADLIKIRDRFEIPLSDEAVAAHRLLPSARGFAGDEVHAARDRGAWADRCRRAT